MSGNGSILAEVTSLQYTSPLAKAGVMFRDSTNANAAMAMLAVTPAAGLFFETRSSNGGSASVQFAPGFATPIWLELTRTGSQFTAYYSTSTAAVPSAASWIQVGSSVPISAFSSTADAGLAVTAESVSALNASSFFGVSISGATSGPAQMFVTPGVRRYRAAGRDGEPFDRSAGQHDAYDLRRHQRDLARRGVALNGPGTLVLSGTNSYSGGTAVNAGTLVVTGSSALPSGTALSVGAGGVLVFDPSVGSAEQGAESGATESAVVTPTAATLPVSSAGRAAGEGSLLPATLGSSAASSFRLPPSAFRLAASLPSPTGRGAGGEGVLLPTGPQDPPKRSKIAVLDAWFARYGSAEE